MWFINDATMYDAMYVFKCFYTAKIKVMPTVCQLFKIFKQELLETANNYLV